MSFEKKAKAKQLSDFFNQCGRIYIVVDATADAVQVPEYLKGDPTLRLALNTRMPQPIYIREDGVSSKFSFSGQAYDCHIPLEHIWAAYEPDGNLEDGLVWEDAVPELIRSVIINQLNASDLRDAGVPEEAELKEDEPAVEIKEEGRPTKVPYLRVVK